MNMFRECVIEPLFDTVAHCIFRDDMGKVYK